MESIDLLTKLEEAVASIQWDDPTFVQLSEAMRVSLPRFTPEQQNELWPRLTDIINVQQEHLAKYAESHMRIRAAMAKMSAQLTETSGQLLKTANLLTDYVKVYGKTMEKLRSLNVDTAEFLIPPIAP